MAETISDLLGGVLGMLLAGEIISVVGAKGGTSLDTTWLSTDSKCSINLFSFSSSVNKMFPLRSRTGGSAFVLALTKSLGFYKLLPNHRQKY